MQEIGYFAAGLSICSSVVFAVIAIIHRRFSVMMTDLCEGEERAHFWTPAIEAWFALYSISAALKWQPDGLTERQLFLAGLAQVKNGLEGTSTAIILFSVALIVFVMIRKFKGHENVMAGKEKA